jgi:GcrA cell cycle regulator
VVFRWTDKTVEKLRLLAAQGLKSAEIGGILGCSHDTVIRKCGREDIALRLRPKPRPKPLGAEALPLTERIGVAAAVAALATQHCKWPVGDPVAPDFHFCSAQKINMSEPYCEKHQHVAVGGKW